MASRCARSSSFIFSRTASAALASAPLLLPARVWTHPSHWIDLQLFVLGRILAGESLGTLFVGQGEPLPAWKRWIGYSVAPRGRLELDPGAIRAIACRGRSLLPIGITGVQGDFHKGELLSLVDAAGVEHARGLTNYNSSDVRRIAGRRSEELPALLGQLKYPEVIHVDNLVVTRAAST